MKKLAQYSALILLLLIVCILSLEGLLRLTGIYSTYFEKNFNQYKSYFDNKCEEGFIYTRKPNSKIEYKQNEFIFTRETNNLGLTQKKFPDTTNKVFTIILGDSFTEGVGAPSDSTWPNLLEGMNNKKCPLATYNAGTGGSDIFFLQKLYEIELKKLRPELTIICLNYSDIFEYVYRKGEERFDEKNNRTCYPSGPKWEKYYKYSHTVRFIVHFLFNYDFTLKSRSWMEKEIPSIFQKMAKEILWIKNNSNDLILIIHPYPYFKDKRLPFHNEFQNILNYLPENLKTINLYPDFEEFFNENDASQYYWEKDGHFNSKGYLQMAKFIDNKLKAIDICEE
jgi:lysophospholipase L1-like esterase